MPVTDRFSQLMMTAIRVVPKGAISQSSA